MTKVIESFSPSRTVVIHTRSSGVLTISDVFQVETVRMDEPGVWHLRFHAKSGNKLGQYYFAVSEILAWFADSVSDPVADTAQEASEPSHDEEDHDVCDVRGIHTHVDITDGLEVIVRGAFLSKPTGNKIRAFFSELLK